MSAFGIGIDVGGTKIAGAVVGPDGGMHARERVESPAADEDAMIAVIGDVAEALRARAGEDLPVCVGAAGLVDLDGVIRYAPNIDWADAPVQQRLVDRLGEGVRVVNDANVAAWGEFRVGAAKDVPGSSVMLTLGTGVGGGFISEGRLFVGSQGLGPEFGHIIIEEGGRRCGCGNLGCLEAYASGSAIAALAASWRAGGRLPAGSALADGDLSGPRITTAAQEGDAGAVEVLATTGFWLGVGIASVVNAVDPAVVVIGGGVIAAGSLLLDPAREAYMARLLGRGHRDPAPVVEATLGGDAGVVGAGLLAADTVGRPPSTPAGRAPSSA